MTQDTSQEVCSKAWTLLKDTHFEEPRTLLPIIKKAIQKGSPEIQRIAQQKCKNQL